MLSPPEQMPTVATGLAGFHEYSVNVSSQLMTIRSTVNATVTARILPPLPVGLNISRVGQLTASWLRKIVENSPERQVDVVMRKLPATELPSPSVQSLTLALDQATERPTVERLPSDETRRQSHLDIRWAGLEMGAAYQMALFDVGSNITTDFIAFNAFPTCLEDEYQLKGLCFWPSAQMSSYFQGNAQCQTRKSTIPRSQPYIAPVITDKEEQLFENISVWLDRSFWVGQQRPRRSSSDGVEEQPGWALRVPRALGPAYRTGSGSAEPPVTSPSTGAEAELLSTPAGRPTPPPDVELLVRRRPALGDADAAARLPPSPPPDVELLDKRLPAPPAAGAPSEHVPPSDAEASFKLPVLQPFANAGLETWHVPAQHPGESREGLPEEASVNWTQPEGDQQCLFVQRGLPGVQRTSNCEMNLHVMCRLALTVSVPELRAEDILVTPRSSWIRLDWRLPDSWHATYQVTVLRRPDGAERGRPKRKVVPSVTYPGPPG
ncbi:uncharacterized protein LOC119111505 [Pollicipes pollicipes]|uniref:uncharacterized protein LOC119111505 n=1 Tax=Pollicipes pollicipes TaxID=41117 RepID=UPI0018857B47|nr:uncharacterized protein LOC119111505 [Pollicipes pollicipes]